MHRGLGVLYALFLILGTSTGLSSQQPLEASEVPRRALLSVVTIQAFDAQGNELRLGSGFFLSDGRVVTNSHVVAGAEWVEISDQEDELLGTIPYAEVISTRSDLAILPKLSTSREGLPLRTEPPETGQAVWVIGSPRGLHGSVSNGVVSAVRTLDGQEYLQISAPVSTGSSGGPILDQQGRVIGVVVSYVTDGQNLNFGVPVKRVAALRNSPVGEYAFRSIDAFDDTEVDAGSSNSSESVSDVLGRAPLLDLPAYQSARLTEDDWSGDDSYYDVYRFRGERGQRVTLAMASDVIDTYLGVTRRADFGGDGEAWIRSDDDGGDGTNSMLNIELPSEGEYVVLATSYDRETGPYEIGIIDTDQLEDEEFEESPVRSSNERWQLVGTSRDSTVWYLDRESMQELSPGVYRVWTRVVYPESAEIDRSLGRWDFRCEYGQYRSRSNFEYVDDEVVDRSHATDDAWLDAPPGSVAEELLDTICR